MKALVHAFSALFVYVLVSGCSLFDFDMSVRDDILFGAPLWESERLGRFMSYTVAESLARACRTTQMNTKIPTSGLSRLAKQVLGEDVRRIENLPSSFSSNFCDPKTQGKTPLTPTTFTEEANDAKPLSDKVAQSPVAKALIELIVAEYEATGAVVRYENDKPISYRPSKIKLKHNSLDRGDFRNFADLLIRTQWKPYQAKVGPLPYVPDREDPGIPLQQIITSYLMEYYNGTYVDRWGTAYSKPAVGFSITNEVIVAVANIFQNAIWDYVQLDFSQHVQAPMIYVDWDNSTSKPTAYVNGTGEEPTFAKLIRVKELMDVTHKLHGVLEKVVANGKIPGLTKAEVCVIQHMSGLSGEASEAVAGLVVRSIGGAEAGPFVLFGKISFGDHETLRS